jgi:hypothetical protein
MGRIARMLAAGRLRDEARLMDGCDEARLLELAAVDLSCWDVLGPIRELDEAVGGQSHFDRVDFRAWNLGLTQEPLLERERFGRLTVAAATVVPATADEADG